MNSFYDKIENRKHLYETTFILVQFWSNFSFDLYIFWHKGAGTNSITESFSENFYKLGEGSFFPEKCITLKKKPQLLPLNCSFMFVNRLTAISVCRLSIHAKVSVLCSCVLVFLLFRGWKYVIKSICSNSNISKVFLGLLSSTWVYFW